MLVSETSTSTPTQAVPSLVEFSVNDESLTATEVFGGYVVGGATLTQGANTVVAVGTTVSILTTGSNTVVNGVTHTRAPITEATGSDNAFTLNGVVIPYSTLASSPGYIIDGQTLQPGSAVTVSSHVFALPATSVTGLVVDGSAVSIVSSSTEPTATDGVLTVQSTAISYTILPSSSGYVVDGKILQPGSTITALGHVFALPSASGAEIAVDGTPVPIAPLDIEPTAVGSVLTAGGAIITYNLLPSSSGIEVAGQTLSPGSTVTVDGHTLAIPTTQGVDIIVDGSTVPFTPVTSKADSNLVVGATPVSYDILPNNVGIVIESETLLPDSTITADGHTFALPVSLGMNINIMVDGSTLVLPAPTANSALLASATGQTPSVSIANGALIVDSQTIPYSALPPGAGVVIEVAGKTLVPGATITADGHTFALPTLGTNLEADGSTFLVPTATIEGTIIIGSQTITYSALTSSMGVIVAGKTLVPGATMTADGNEFAIPISLVTIVVDGSTISLPTSSSDGTIMIGSQAFTYSIPSYGSGIAVAGQTTIIIGGQTLTPGSTIIIEGHSFTLPLFSDTTTTIEVDGSILVLAPTAASTTTSPIIVGTLTINSQEFTYSQLDGPPGSGIVIAEQTVAPGSAVTVRGETISLSALAGSLSEIIVIGVSSTQTIELGGLSTSDGRLDGGGGLITSVSSPSVGAISVTGSLGLLGATSQIIGTRTAASGGGRLPAASSKSGAASLGSKMWSLFLAVVAVGVWTGS